jgi:NAD(P)-dependent dehydrogenase (short-subunit alcohol dehydrogenase family)
MPAPLADVDPSDFERALRVNLVGVFLSMKHEITAMLRGEEGGAIVNVASTAGLTGVRNMGAYSAAKHAVVGLTRSAALDYANRKIRINAIAPGPIMTDRIAALSDEQREPIIRAVPSGRIGDPWDLATAAAWLCSDLATFVTGATVPIDGGRLAQ